MGVLKFNYIYIYMHSMLHCVVIFLECLENVSLLELTVFKNIWNI